MMFLFFFQIFATNFIIVSTILITHIKYRNCSKKAKISSTKTLAKVCSAEAWTFVYREKKKHLFLFLILNDLDTN